MTRDWEKAAHMDDDERIQAMRQGLAALDNTPALALHLDAMPLARQAIAHTRDILALHDTHPADIAELARQTGDHTP